MYFGLSLFSEYHFLNSLFTYTIPKEAVSLSPPFVVVAIVFSSEPITASYKGLSLNTSSLPKFFATGISFVIKFWYLVLVICLL